MIAFVTVALTGCGDDAPGPNRAPTVCFDDGIVEGDTLSYALDIGWSGQDADGNIVRYEVALDPPPEFTETEIAEGGPGIVIQELPARRNLPAITRYYKPLGDRTVHFEWVHTTKLSRRFTVKADEPPPEPEPPHPVHSRAHRVYVRAVDDDGAISVPDMRGFTAVSQAPRSRLHPHTTELTPEGAIARLRWSAVDPDGPTPTKFWIAYMFPDKLTPEDELTFELLQRHGTWRLVETTEFALPVEPPTLLLFGVLAIDEAGVVEPFMNPGRSLGRLAIIRAWLPPDILVLDPYYAPPPGAILRECWSDPIPGEYSNDPCPHRIRLYPGVPFDPTWVSQDGYHPETVVAYRYGFDVDPESDAGWSAWDIKTTRLAGPVRFERGSRHVLTIQARHDLGTISTRRIELITPELSTGEPRDFLIVDDYRDQTDPTDPQHDTFWQQLIEGYAVHDPGFDPGSVYFFNAWGDTERSTNPITLKLSEMLQYRTIIWSNLGAGRGGLSSLFSSAVRNRFLGEYVQQGGQLWILGSRNMAAMLPSGNGTAADLDYPRVIDEPGMFPALWFHLTHVEVFNAKDEPVETLIAAQPTGLAPYPRLDVDKAKLNVVQAGEGGIRYVDAMEPLSVRPADRGFREVLYEYRSAGVWDRGVYPEPVETDFERRIIATRWHDPDPDPVHRRTQWFGFPLYYMQDDQAQEVFNRTLDWFREER